MWRIAGVSTFGLILAMNGPAVAADPAQQTESVRAGGGEVLEFGAFQCTAAKPDGDKPVWTCPAQSFASKFKEAPTVLFSIAGFDRLATADGSLSLDVETKDDIAKSGFQPLVNDRADKPMGLDKSAIRVTWIAIGEGERVQKPRPTAEERLKRRQEQKAKSQ